MVVWIIGLSGSGKTTVGTLLVNRIRAMHGACVLLDGDLVRNAFENDLGHTISDRRANSFRISRFSALLAHQGLHVVAPVLSLFPEDREWNRLNIANYFEVYLKADVNLLTHRDSRKVYSKGEAAKSSPVVGLDIPFPEPISPDLVIVNDFKVTPQSMEETVYQKIMERGCLD